VYLNALSLYFVGHKLRDARVPLLPRVCEALIYAIFNCSIPLDAKIGAGTRCGHRGIAVVIHPGVEIGERCLIRAQVVIGGSGRDDGSAGAPIIGDDVEIGVGAKLIGPIHVGNGAVIGANAVVLSDVPSEAVAVGVPARIVRSG
jgi:serine O-acetyltransferase